MIKIKSIGKVFEEEFKKSVPKEVYYYRLRDAASFGGNENTRFTTSNMCDCLTMTDDYLFFIELKSHKGSSIPLSCIRKNQLEELAKIEHKRIKAYFVINFREKERTFGIEAKKLKDYTTSTERKSIPLDWCDKNGIEIDMQKLRTNYRYNLNDFFKEASRN